MAADAGRNRDWLLGRRFVDGGKEYVVMRLCPKRWKRSLLDVAF